MKLVQLVVTTFLPLSLGMSLRGCSDVHYAYSARGVRNAPMSPIDGNSLQICRSESTCCTREMEASLTALAAKQYEEAVIRKASNMGQPFKSKARKVDDFMRNLVYDSQRQLHDIFTRTYGVLYERNALLFRDYFRQLSAFHAGEDINLHDATIAFFTALYQKMFQVMNAQYTFDDVYLTCVVRHMSEQKPFGDVPERVATSVQRSMTGIRALVQAFKTAHDIMEEVKLTPSSRECILAVQKMNACPTCQGMPGLKPCDNYCLEVIRGCLSDHAELQSQWDRFIESLDNLADRLVSAFNVETIILPLDINISDAIMNFQDSGYQVTQKVFDTCGQPKLLRKREAIIQDDSGLLGRGRQVGFVQGIQSANIKGRRSDFEKLINDLKKMFQETVGFWTNLPNEMCRMDNLPIGGECWNGQDTTIRAQALKAEPVINLNTNNTRNVFSKHIILLEDVNTQLQKAHNGQEVKWWYTEGPRDGFLMVFGDRSNRNNNNYRDVDFYDGSGSGDGADFFGGFDDDEDRVEGSGEGSGIDCDDSDGCNTEWPWTTWSKEKETQPTWPSHTSTSTTKTTDIHIVDEHEIDESVNEVNVIDNTGSSSCRALHKLDLMTNFMALIVSQVLIAFYLGAW